MPSAGAVQGRKNDAAAQAQDAVNKAKEAVQDSGKYPPNCMTATRDNNPQCFRNVNWAKYTGYKSHPEWYQGFHYLNADASFEAFQLALAKDSSPKHWNCTHVPCGF